MWSRNQASTSGRYNLICKAAPARACRQGSGVNSPLQIQPQVLNWTEVWALTRPLQNIQLVIDEASHRGHGNSYSNVKTIEVVSTFYKQCTCKKKYG